MTEIMTIVQRALIEAGDILRSHYGRLERIEQKGDIDLVTIADRESEAAIVNLVRNAFPSHGILAEEGGAQAEGEYTWVIDPLDGTTNYAHNFPLFSISIAVMHGDKPMAAGVANPYYKETYLAEAGSGATLNGAPIRVSKVQTLDKALMVTGFPYDRRERLDHYLLGVGQFLNHAQGVLRLGSAALDLCAVAAGRMEGFWEEKLNPWDTAAGWLIVEEAGGKVTDFRGAPYSPFGNQILATNGPIHPECIAALKPLL